MIPDQKSPEAEAWLVHFGVMGMKWGVRKSQPTSSPNLNFKPEGVTVRADGSISIKKGASLQRLVRSNGKSAPLQDLTYASMLEYDNARYVKIIGKKGLFGGGRDQILGLQATRKIEAPSKDEATRIVSEMMLKNSEFRKRNTILFGGPITDKDLQRIRDDPGGKHAKSLYEMTNTKMTLDKNIDPDAPFVQSMLRTELARRGYNALRDENDAGKLAHSPIIIFSPEKSLKVTSLTDITDELRRSNKETLAAYKAQGKDWIERELYGSS